MIKELSESFNVTFLKIKKYPQLFWTIFVALIIGLGFILVVQQFISIAQDSQENLINVRIGSIQDSLSEFVELEEGEKEQINSAIVNLMTQNPTIIEFNFYKKEDSAFKVFASSKPELLDTLKPTLNPIESIAVNDPNNSYTFRMNTEKERLYQTYRALTKDGQIIGFVETIQTLSQADKILEQRIRNGIIIFVFILIVIMFLFFRHSKIIDYISLYEELKQVDRLKDDFISMASHEFKTPLTTMRGYSEFIIEADEIPEEYKEYARRIDISSKQLAFLVDDMLDVSRIEQGRMQFNFGKLLVPDFIQNLTSDFKTLAQEKGLQFTYQHTGLTHASVMLDEVRFRQVLVNLVGNAIKYTPKGEVKVVLSNEREKLKIIISDTGIGMNEQERKNLFEKFYRIKNAETQEVKGTGLGLWITKQLVEKMHGTISVESIKGVGTHVVMEFPGLV